MPRYSAALYVFDQLVLRRPLLKPMRLMIALLAAGGTARLGVLPGWGSGVTREAAISQ